MLAGFHDSDAELDEDFEYEYGAPAYGARRAVNGGYRAVERRRALFLASNLGAAPLATPTLTRGSWPA